MRFRLVMLATALVCLIQPAASDAARRLDLGFQDSLFLSGDAPSWLKRAASDGSDVARLPTSWSGTSPTRPGNPIDPGDPAYRWAALDAGVKAAVANGLSPLVSFVYAPAWAEGPGRPKGVTVGAWRPDAAAFGAFAQAAARRYDGTYPDPSAPGRTLPKVTAFQPWNEPNLDRYLAPQWTESNGTFTAASPGIYRVLQNAFTAGIHAVQPRATVVTAGTGPFGDPDPGGSRIMPVRFWRGVLCLDDSGKKRLKGCGNVRFDALSHHPYSIRGPFSPALNADDVSIADMTKLTKLLKTAERLRSAPDKHEVWVTEVSWDSKPDDPYGIPERTQAKWLSQTFMSLWQQGVDTITWNQIRDTPGPNFGSTAQSGTYRANGLPKLSAQAFRFPLAVEKRSTRKQTYVWLRSPAAGRIKIQLRRGGRWRTVKTVTGTRHGVLEVRVNAGGGSSVRGVQGAVTSLAAGV